MVKFLYVVPSFATDRQRDIDGEIGRYVFNANEWLASQNAGFGLRVDTFEGAIDVPYVEIETTPEEWESWFALSLAPAAELLISKGWPIGRGVETNGDDLYFVVWEAFAGNYLKTGASGGGCRGLIDGQNAGYRMVGYAVAWSDGKPCTMDHGRFPFNGEPIKQRSWMSTFGPPDIGFVDHTIQFMRFLPNCGQPQSPRDGEPYVVPGTNITEIRGGFIRDLLEPNDPIGMRMSEARPGTVPELDPRHDTYFHITSGPLARIGCNSDAGRHPLWSDKPFYPNAPTVPRRSVIDRPDDAEGPQLHAVYVRAKETLDRALDTGLEIPAALRDLDNWWRSQTDGVGIRLDTFKGHLDITYLPLSMTVQDFVDSGTCIGERCPSDADFERILKEAGYSNPDKWYVFFYDGGISPEGLCGGARNGSRTMLINLTDFSTGRCQIPWRASELDTWSLGLLVGHELLHTLDAVCTSAPDSDNYLHSTNVNDLMFGGADGDGIVLDVGRDSYWGPSAPRECDVSTHPLFTTDINLSPDDGTSYESVNVEQTDLVPSERTWWLNERVTSASTADDNTQLPELTLPASQAGETVPKGNVTQNQVELAQILNTVFDVDPRVTPKNRIFSIFGGEGLEPVIERVIERLNDYPKFNFVLIANPTTTDCPGASLRCVDAPVRLVVGNRDAGIELKPIWIEDQGRWKLSSQSFCEFSEILSVPC